MPQDNKTIVGNRPNVKGWVVPSFLWKSLVIAAIVISSLSIALHSRSDASTLIAAHQASLRKYVPDTVSEDWHKVFTERFSNPENAQQFPGPNDLKGWEKIRNYFEGATEQKSCSENSTVKVNKTDLGGVPVLEVTPEGWVDNDKVLVYTHGGAYTLFSACSTLPRAALVANRTGLRVISVDYTNPPQARWREVIEQVVNVFKALNRKGTAMSQIAIYGDSAGGSLAAGAVLKLRDDGLGMPAAIVLWSPWADITETGDTYTTLKGAEPIFLYEKVLGPSANAYAETKDQKHPYVSPVYADFSKGFPPTLIQGGTRELFLSNFVRLYQALDTSGQDVKLDLYEGMPHVFQIISPSSPESVTALNKMAAFLEMHLDK